MQFIDLSSTISNETIEPIFPKIKYVKHKKGGTLLGLASLLSEKSFLHTLRNLIRYCFGINRVRAKDFPDGMGLAWEDMKLGTHTGTHLDAPWHFGPSCDGKPAKTIDEVPLEWCYGDGIVLDLRHKRPGSLITKEDIQLALQNINYDIKKGDIVLIMTGARKYAQDKKYLLAHPGMSREAVLWLVEKGIKIIGTDGWGFDRSFRRMIKEYSKTKENKHLWPAHLAGREKEYCHIETMANLDKIPKPYGFKVICFPIKLKAASAAWIRPVAIIAENM
ncbi:cyclase family protein [bacterium]|nr:cyclase family protein [bacterium]